MGRSIKYDSRWIVDRKWFEGATWVLRFTACGGRCRLCRLDETPQPRHGPYWTVFVEVDGRNHQKHHPVDKPLPWGDRPPPSLKPSELDPNSRLNKKRAARVAAMVAHAAAAVAAAPPTTHAKRAGAKSHISYLELTGDPGNGGRELLAICHDVRALAFAPAATATCKRCRARVRAAPAWLTRARESA